MTNTVRLSTKDFTRRESGELVSYRGDLGIRAVRYSRELSFWPWGRSEGSLASGAIEIDNRTGRYDQLVFRDLRDQDLQVKLPTVEGTDIIAVTAIVDSTEAPDDKSVRVSLKDTLTLLDVPIQQDVFGDDADESVEGRPLPITLGVARSIRPPLWEAFPVDTGPAYRVHDAALSGVFAVRDKGITLSATTSPPQFELDSRIGNAGITLETEPVGVLTLDASTSGDLIIPAEPTDALSATGAFDESFTTANTSNTSVIPDWEFDGAQPEGGTSSVSYSSTFNAALIEAASTQSARAGITSDTQVLEAGKSYRWQLEIFRRVQYFTSVGGTIASQGAFRLTATTSQDVQDALSPSNGTNLLLRKTLDSNNSEGVYSGTYSPPANRYVQLACVNGGNVVVGRVTFIEIPPPPSDELEGITLKDYSLEIVRRAGLSDGRIVSSTIDAIDPDAAQIGIYVDEPITALGMMRAPLDSYCADIYSDRDGNYRFAQLRDPADEVPTLLINADNLASPPRVTLDKAEGLTTSIIARRNYYQFREADFADNDSELPLDLREKLSQPGQFQRNAALPETGLPTIYRHAIEAEPLVSLFDTAADALTQIQRVIDLYADLRFRVEVQIWLDPGEFVELDTIAELVYPRYGFDEGRQFLVYGVTDEVTDEARRRLCNLRLWG